MNFADITVILAFLAALMGLMTAILNFVNQRKIDGSFFKLILQKYFDLWQKYKTFFYLYSLVTSIWIIQDFLKSTANITRHDIFFTMLAGLNILFTLITIGIDRILGIVDRHLNLTESMQGQFSGMLDVMKDLATVSKKQQHHLEKYLDTTKLLINKIPAKKKKSAKK